MSQSVGTESEGIWQKDEGSLHYYDASGSLMTWNFFVSDRQLYYADRSGVVCTDTWFKVGEKYYHADENGVLATGTKEIDQTTYQFGTAGDLTDHLEEMQQITVLSEEENPDPETDVLQQILSGEIILKDTESASDDTETVAEEGDQTVSEEGDQTVSEEDGNTASDSDGTEAEAVSGNDISQANDDSSGKDTSQAIDDSSGNNTSRINNDSSSDKISSAEEGSVSNQDSQNLFAAAGAVTSLTVSDVQPGWYEADEAYRYRKTDGTDATLEWIQDGGYWYYFDENGLMMSETFFTVEGNIYYARKWGGIYTGKQFQVNGSTYRAKSWGGLYTGLNKIGTITYRFDDNGVLLGVQEGWYEKNGSSYYCKSGGVNAVSEWISADGKWYYFDASGICLKNTFFTVKGSIYYATENGSIYQNTFFEVDGKKYRAKSWGGLYTGTVTIDNVSWKFDAQGVLLSTTPHWEKKGNDWYYMKSDTSYAVSEWEKISGYWYYLDEEGVMVSSSFFKVNGKLYYARSWGGIYQGGTRQIDGKTYCFADSGAIYLGWIKYKDGSYCYADPDTGAFLTGQFLNDKGYLYYLGSDGKMAVGWNTISGEQYLFRSWGGAYVDTDVVIGDYKYSFDENGVLTGRTLAVDNGADACPVSAEKGVKTIRNFLQNALQPIGSTLYIWGGGHDAPDIGTYGTYSQWELFYRKNDSTYDYTRHEYEFGNGLDCSGYVSWAAFQLFGKTIDEISTVIPYKFQTYGWGSATVGYNDGIFYPGDVVAMSGHIWIVIGQCEDGSVVIAHSSPPCVQISGTVTPDGNTDSEAAALAEQYMSTYYPVTYERYGCIVRSLSYLKNVNRFTWSASVMPDYNLYKGMNAAEVLKLIYEE